MASENLPPVRTFPRKAEIMEITIPCETIVRLQSLIASLPASFDPVWSTIRFDNGQAVVSDRCFMAIENIKAFEGVGHIIVSPEFLAQCVTEAQFNGDALIVINEALSYAVAKTTFGWQSDNLFFAGVGTDFDKWRAIVKDAAADREKSSGGMFWNAREVAALAETSPSGRIVFAEFIDTAHPTLVRDVTDYDWLGVFMPRDKPGGSTVRAAEITSWMKF